MNSWGLRTDLKQKDQHSARSTDTHSVLPSLGGTTQPDQTQPNLSRATQVRIRLSPRTAPGTTLPQGYPHPYFAGQHSTHLQDPAAVAMSAGCVLASIPYHCVAYLSHCCYNIPDRSNLSREQFILAYNWKVQLAHHGRRGMARRRQEHEALGHTVCDKSQEAKREMNAAVQLCGPKRNCRMAH